MEHLIELSKYLSNPGLRFHNTIGKLNDKAEKLYKEIIRNKIKNNANAKELLFRDKKHSVNLLWRTKKRLHTRLINSLLQIQIPQEEFYKKEFLNIYKEYVATKILRAEGKRKAFIGIAQKLLQKAIKFQITEIVLSVAKELRLHYSFIAPEKQKVDLYNQLIKEFQGYLTIENEIDASYCEFILTLQRTKNLDDTQIRKAKILVDNVQMLLNKRKTYWTVLLTSDICITFYQITNDYAKISQIGQNAFNYFESLSYEVPKNAKFSFAFRVIPFLILQKKYKEANLNIEFCSKIFPPGHLNWALVKQYKVILQFYKKEYNDVFNEINSIKEHAPRFFSKESWLLYEAYAKILTDKKLRLGKFLNEVPKFSKDLRGMNINILIIQVLEYTRRGNRNEVIDRTSALKQYIRRHLQKEDTFRSNCFINMLLCLEKGYFNPIAVARHAEKHLIGLKKLSLMDSKQDFDVEIVPYEDLWNFLLKILKN